ncbi:bacillithiol biosynthesis deacetylase BshB1 [Larkinella rosea]|uniref:Bacillithiol biosynthesis deacetylase BshB1 n=1 Tax=Larkinella rosea TaxID=2025312 RepID=A0A3P1C0L9_9BACT|nr:bacillithiol biosynthesis deacetylase BshB1 [Larkinella rosea]RRB06887.1 bacillithiol biosynthesis deacetylase BshB1 [Larkinella rosea]
MKLDLLVIAVHPDDAELGCAGTILSLVAQGKKVGIVDLTRGELGTRGTPEIRLQEAEDAARILGLSARENMNFRDGFFRNDEEHQKALIVAIRKYQPEIVITNAIYDRHPDHGRASELVVDACFYSGLRQIKTVDNLGVDATRNDQAAWRPKIVYHLIQDRYIKPDFIVDITDFYDKKQESLLAYKSQFYDPKSNEPMSYIASQEFMEFLRARAEEFGHVIGVKYGEGFTVDRTIGVTDLFALK